MKIKEFCLLLVVKTEKFLTWNKKREEAKKAKQKKKNQILDWAEAFLWAAGVVLLVNQYLVQAYTIPSGSMIDTLLEKDRIFVNKIVYGPELVPGHFKIRGFAEPQRSEVMIFESPEYDSNGPVFDIAQRLIYMLTLSIWDIDGRDENGQPKVHFLIKRLVGIDGDTIKFVKGDLFIKPRGTLEWQPEESFKKASGFIYHNSRLIDLEQYPDYYFGIYNFIMEKKLGGNLTVKDSEDLVLLAKSDLYAKKILILSDYIITPQDSRLRNNYWSVEQGQYVPDGWILPLGDNRDNSKDGRFFGPVPKSKVLGRAMFIYWPLYRARNIK